MLVNEKLCIVPYKMKYLQEYYLAKCIEKHFGKINIGDLDEIKHDTRKLLVD